MSATGEVTATTRIAAPPEIVFPYFTDPALIGTWLSETAEVDPRPGGIFAINPGRPAHGTYVAVEPPHRVVFTWGIPGDATMPPGASTVEVILAADGDATIVTLTHTDLPADHRESHQRGWTKLIGLLPNAVQSR
jgi:uncharacterized protein YndB with AHSA1/START domain